MPTILYRRNVDQEIQAGLDAIGHTLDVVYHRNPQFYGGEVESGCTSVVVVGEYPEIVERYEAAGIKVTVVERPVVKATKKRKPRKRATVVSAADTEDFANANVSEDA